MGLISDSFYRMRGIVFAFGVSVLLLINNQCTAESSGKNHNAITDESQTIAIATERSVSLYYGRTDAARATGILLDDGHTVLTVLHAKPNDGKNIYIAANSDPKRYEAKVIAVSDKMDLMALRLQEELPHTGKLRWRTRDEIRSGEKLFLVGAPYGLDGTLLTGYLSHTDRTGVDAAFPDIPFLQTMGLSFPATSGGAIFDTEGGVIGINRATFGESIGNGIGLAVPATYAVVFLKFNRLEAE
jgi:S1-C subfamily serine protease